MRGGHQCEVGIIDRWASVRGGHTMDIAFGCR